MAAAKTPLKRFCNWFVQILIIASIVMVYFFPDNWFILLVVYAGYVWNCFTSPTLKYLKNINETELIHDKMKNLFYKPPVFHMHTNSYHMETRRRKRGKYGTHAYTVKVSKFFDTKEFKISSWRDTSGIFLLNSNNTKKCFIKLDLYLQADFADDITSLEYNKQIEVMMARNRFKDT